VALLATKMRLNGDDYCLDAILLREGLWGMVIRSYMEISMYNGNRYSQIFFLGLAGLSPIWGNGFLVVGSLIAWLMGLFFLVRWISNRLDLSLKVVEVLIIAQGYASLLLWSTQRLDQSVIWRSAMTAYFMPLMALTLLLVLIIHTAESNGQKWWRYLVIFLTALMASGFSEAGAAFQAGSLGLLLLLTFVLVKSKNGKKAYLVPMLIALGGVFAGVALMYFSPVTAMRRTSMPEAVSLSALLVLLGINLKVYLWQLVVRRTLVLILPFMFGLGLGLVHFAIRLPGKDRPISKFTWKHWSLFLALLPVAAILLITCVMLPATYVQGDYPPERALILAQSVVTMAGLMGGIFTVLWLHALVDLIKTRPVWFQYLLRGISLLLVLSVIISPILLVWQHADKLPFYSRWSQMWLLRHEQLVEAGRMNMDEIHVIELDHIVSDVGELSPDPDYWYNNCAEMYYGIDAIYADLPGW
jgi:hypothetical protein